MAYPGQFHRLVMIGTIYTDVFNMTLSIVPNALGELGMPAVDDTTLEAVSEDVSAWFVKNAAATGPSFIAAAKLTSIKLNRIDTAGHYVDQDAKEWLYPSPISGATAGVDLPAQLSIVATLGTALERGRGSKGRIYTAPSAFATVSTDGRMTTSNALGMANGVKSLITSLNATYALVGRVGVASNAGAGRFEHVTKVSVGRVVDTMRSRRSTLVEDRQTVTI